jgi:radical SAM protein with 4Fe4S-binding SPASM domain
MAAPAEGPVGLPPRPFVLQWHLTERCNLRCRHCYQEGYLGPELALPELLSIVEQFTALLDRIERERAPRAVRGHINLTGGEPFARDDLFELLDALARLRDRFSYAILTNGTQIDSATARRLRPLGPKFVQVSIEGDAPTNDAVRGQGVFDRTLAALEHLSHEGIPTIVAFTAHRGNLGEFGHVVRTACRLRVAKVWADRLIPCGQGGALDNGLLDPDETRQLFEAMHAARREAGRRLSRTEVSLGRALQFLVGGGTPYRCVAGENLVAVQPNGDLLPCRRLPIPVGNLTTARLTDLYYQSELFQALRRHRVSEGCVDCRFARQCRGGLRCLAYAVTGDPFQADPGCWLARQPHAAAVT